MKKYFLLILFLLTIGCATLQIPRFQQEKQISVGRGIKMEFVQNMPPSEIKGPFRVGLKFTNNNPIEITGNLNLRDVASYQGFEDINQPVYLEPALVEYSEPDQRTGEPVIKSYTPSSKFEDFGTIKYVDILQGATTQFIAEFNFDYTSNLNAPICIASFGSRTISCPTNEIISGSRLGLENQFAPIVTSVTKKASSSTPGQALLELEINLDNVGGGELKGSDFLIANINLIGDGTELSCNSQNAVSSSGNQFEMQLTNNKARINCFADLSFAGDLSVNNLVVSLSYPYRLIANTGIIKVQ